MKYDFSWPRAQVVLLVIDLTLSYLYFHILLIVLAYIKSTALIANLSQTHEQSKSALMK